MLKNLRIYQQLVINKIRYKATAFSFISRVGIVRYKLPVRQRTPHRHRTARLSLFNNTAINTMGLLDTFQNDFNLICR